RVTRQPSNESSDLDWILKCAYGGSPVRLACAWDGRNDVMRMFTAKALSGTILVVVMAVVLVLFAHAGSEGKVLTVKGNVVAVNHKVDPQIIVDKAMTQHNQQQTNRATNTKATTNTHTNKP